MVRIAIHIARFIYVFIETYLYRVDIIMIIGSQAIFHMCHFMILLYENKQSIKLYIIQMKY